MFAKESFRLREVPIAGTCVNSELSNAVLHILGQLPMNLARQGDWRLDTFHWPISLPLKSLFHHSDLCIVRLCQLLIEINCAEYRRAD
jgi:hypothetical protein